jgi:hypothetical protein
MSLWRRPLAGCALDTVRGIRGLVGPIVPRRRVWTDGSPLRTVTPARSRSGCRPVWTRSGARCEAAGPRATG